MILFRILIRLIRFPFDVLFLTIDFCRFILYVFASIPGYVKGVGILPYNACLRGKDIETPRGKINQCALSKKYGTPSLICLLCRGTGTSRRAPGIITCESEGIPKFHIIGFLGMGLLFLMLWGAVLGACGYVLVKRYGNPLAKPSESAELPQDAEPESSPFDDARRAAEWTERGQASLQAGEYSRARTEFQKATELDGANVSAFLGLARANEKTNFMGEAAKSIDYALKLDPENLDALIEAANIAYQNKNYRKALDHAAKALDLDDNNYEALLQLVRAQRCLGNMDAAAETAKRMVAVKPDDPRSSLECAAIALKKGNLLEAERGFRRCIDLDPTMVGARIGLAQVLGARGDFAGAIDLLGALCLEKPDEVSPRIELAEMMLRNGQPKEALAIFKKLCTDFPERYAVRARYAELLSQNGHYDKSYNVLMNLLQDHPGDAMAHMVLADLFLRRGLMTLAEQHVKKALAQRPRDARAYRLRARIVMAQGNLDNAIRILRVLLDHLPKDLELRMRLAFCLAKQGEVEAAETELLRASRLHPEKSAPYLQLAQLYTDEKRYADAAKQYRTALKRTPKSAGAWNNLALVMLQGGESPADAVTAARKAYDLAPANPKVNDTLAWCLFHAGHVKEALPLSEIAARQLPDEAGVRYHYGVILAKLGKAKQACAELEAALKHDDAFSERDAAAKLLAELKGKTKP